MIPRNEVQRENLPSLEERRRILEQARQILIDARCVMDQLDQRREAFPLVALLGETSNARVPQLFATGAETCR